MKIARRPYDSLLPFLVVEALSSDGISFSSISVKMSDRGWAWIISGRKLFIWKFKDTKSSTAKARKTLSPCYELQLPPSDLLHKADLVHVFFMPHGTTTGKTQNVPATIAVSPEGTIRFWSNIANERFTEALACDLQGQECYTLVPLSHFEYAIGATTNSVFLLSIDISAHDARNILCCSMLNTPESLLSGIGRKMTNLLFGSMPSDQSGESSRPLIAVIKHSSSHTSSSIDSPSANSDKHLFIMSSNLKLQRWVRSNGVGSSSNQILNAWDLQKSLSDHLIANLWGREVDDYNQISIWPIDMITAKSNELIILLATMNHGARNHIVNYAIARFNPNQVSNNISGLNILTSHKCPYNKASEEQLLSLRFVERRATNSSICFLFDRKYLFLSKIDGDIIDAVDFLNQQDSILGANTIDGHPLIFTQRDGLISVTTSSIGFDSPQLVDLSDQESEICYGDDALSKMSSAFQEHNRQDMMSCQQIIKDLIRNNNVSDRKNDINEAAFHLSLEIMDGEFKSVQEAKLYGLPESTKTVFAMSYTKIDSIVRFKLDLHRAFIDFLKVSHLWTELSILKKKNETLSTHFILEEHREKLVVALLLLDLHSQKKYSKIVEDTLATLANEKRSKTANLQANNIQTMENLMRRTSNLQELLPALLRHELSNLNIMNNPNTSSIVDLVLNVTFIFEEVFRRVQNLRKSNDFSNGDIQKCGQIPWTSQVSEGFANSPLIEQFDVIIRYGVESALASATIVDSLESRDRIYTGLMNIANWIFEEYQTCITLCDKGDPRYDKLLKSYEKARSKCFKPLIDAKFKQAADLAEKHRDFLALTRICEACDSQEMLKLYISKFDDFAEYLFNYFLKEGKQNELLATLPSPKLSAFLREHNQLKWLHQIELRQYDAASVTLSRLADVENINPEKKRTLLSLSKLAKLAGDDSI